MSEVALKNVNGSLKDMVREFERQLIEAALAASAGNQRRAAATLGLLPTTLHEKMKRLGLLRRGVPSAMEQEETGASMRM
jgi:DNA-binding NtrC family response regulator